MKSTGWVTTLRQAAPQFFKLVQQMKPTVHAASITSVDETFLVTHAVSAILWDVDGTLMPHHERVVASEVRAVLATTEKTL